MQFFQVDYLDVGELQFWQSLLQKYLRPIKKDKKTEEKIQQDLIGMRNNASFGFWMINTIWILLNFMLQLHVAPITIFIRSNGVPVKCEPLGFVFIVFFLLVLTLQVIGMLKHRYIRVLCISP
jgi:chitin synthase